MWQEKTQNIIRKHRKASGSVLISLCVGILALAGCGASASNTATSAPVNTLQHQAAFSSNSDGTTSGAQQGTTSGGKTQQYRPQYLTKSLQVTILVQDTRQAASDLQNWIITTDPQATSDGLDYQQTGDNRYNVTVTFLVEAANYAQIEAYLNDYARQSGRQLVSLHENVQDVTNDYIDTQAQLDDLRAERQRLLTFLNQAQNLNDTLNLEQQVTQVEGKIDDIQAHLNALKGQTTYYTITINLQPTGTPTAPPPVTSSVWNPGSIWQGAWELVVNIWHVLLTLLIWLAAFSVYVIPVGVVIWLLRRWRWHRLPQFARAAPAMSMPQPKDDGGQ